MGNWLHWFKHSDHMPLIIDFDDYLFKEFGTGPERIPLVIATKEGRKEVKRIREEYKEHYLPHNMKYGDYKKEMW